MKELKVRARGQMEKPGKSHTILVVDDDPDIVEVLADRLTADGFAVLKAGNGCQALQQVTRWAPAAVVMDFQMPLMNGLEALRAIQRIKSPPPVIMITGAALLHLPSLLLKAGAMDCLLKPFEYGTLRARLEQALGPRGEAVRET